MHLRTFSTGGNSSPRQNLVHPQSRPCTIRRMLNPLIPTLIPSLHALALRAGPLDFSDPAWLWALLVFIPILYFWKTSRVPATPLRKWVTLALRSILVLAIVLSLAGTRVVWFNKGICVVFVLDQSQSVPGQAREVVRERLQTEVDKMTQDDRFVVVEFGGDAVLGSLPSAKGQMPPPVKVSEPGRTDIARALRLALASFPQDRQKRIVLFSDGNQNSGDALREARLAAAKDVDVDVFMLSAQQGHELMVEQVIVPPRVRKDANFNVRAIISSDTPQDAQLLVTRDGSPLQPMTTRLKPGTNVIDLPNQMSEGGYHEFQVTVVPNNPENDTFAANNTGYAFTNVEAAGRVLLIRGKPDIQTQLYQALQSTGIPVDVGTVNSLPTSVKDFARYDSVMLDDVDASRLAPTQMTELARWVKEFGGGLVLIGGDSSFGPGGYKNTPLEEVSPVDMDVKREKHLASLAIVIVNDKSGSMGMTVSGNREKMDLANEGSCEVLKVLDATDFAMIGAVDTEVKWMWNGSTIRPVPMTNANKAAMMSLTRACKAGGGGIYCETALLHAYELVNDSHIDAMAKHVIMFADLQDSEQQENCVRMADQNFRLHGVTTSVIGMGTERDPDAQFQKDVAKAGHGRWAWADDVTRLPRLFAKEAFLVARRAFVENPKGITPTLYTSPLLEGFLATGGGVPKIYGYVGTTLKPRASLAMHGVEPDDPLLASWSIGLGKCVAYTSDSTRRWGRDWVAWNGYAKFWSQIVRWTSRSMQNSGLTTTTVMDGNEGRVMVDAVDDQGKPLNNLQLKADVILPDASSASKDVQLEQIAPGRYQGKFTASQRAARISSASPMEKPATPSPPAAASSPTPRVPRPQTQRRPHARHRRHHHWQIPRRSRHRLHAETRPRPHLLATLGNPPPHRLMRPPLRRCLAPPQHRRLVPRPPPRQRPPRHRPKRRRTKRRQPRRLPQHQILQARRRNPARIPPRPRRIPRQDRPLTDHTNHRPGRSHRPRDCGPSTRSHPGRTRRPRLHQPPHERQKARRRPDPRTIRQTQVIVKNSDPPPQNIGPSIEVRHV